jgi:hypothetical protein
MYKDLQRLISENQHGYVKGRSTVSNLLEYTSFILKSMEDGLQLESIYSDFSKAFDKVRHKLLLIKLALPVPRLSAGYFAHTSPAEHNELGSEAAFRKRSKSRRGLLRVAIWFFNDIAQIFKYVRVLFMPMT